MELKNITNKEKTKKVSKPTRRKKGLTHYRDITYEYEMNEKVIVNEEGKKVNTKLKKKVYRITKVYEGNLGDMLCWMVHLNTEDDPNVRNPYCEHHFTPINSLEK